MKKGKNLRPLLFKVFIGIILLCILFFVISKITRRTKPHLPVTENVTVCKADYWDDKNGCVAADVSYEKDQSKYKSSLLEEYKSSGLSPRIAKISKNGWNLILLNKKNILPDNYEINLAEIGGSDIKMDSDAASYFNKMYIAASKAKIVLTPVSGYRTVSFQRKLFENKVSSFITESGCAEKTAVLKAVKEVNIPASSEHNAGLAVDIISEDKSFSETKEYKWLLKNAENYGFILRYPSDKVSFTGIEFKPYHWRFVGINAAKEMNSKSQCLEEYLGARKK